jgi:hypothetical protein
MRKSRPEEEELDFIELIGGKGSIDEVARHAFGISIVKLSPEDRIQLRKEIGEWLEEQWKSIFHLGIT